MKADPKDFLHLHLLVFLWGFTAILGCFIKIPAVEVVFYRTLFASCGLAMVLYFNKFNFSIGRKAILKIFGTGFLIAGDWILFFTSARISTVSVCLAGLATCSFWTSFLEPLMTGRKIKWFEVMLGLLVIAGLYIIFRFEFDHALGLAMGVAAALIASLFTVINGKFTQEFNPYTITFYEMLGACAGTMLFFPIYIFSSLTNQQLHLAIDWMDFLYLVILSFICTVYAYSAAVELMKKISAFAMNLTVNLEPVYGIILALLIFGDKEKMQPQFYFGAAIVLLSVLAHPFLNKYYNRKFLETDALR